MDPINHLRHLANLLTIAFMVTFLIQLVAHIR